MQSIYDDNIFQVADDDLRIDPAEPRRPGVGSYDDLILRPGLTLDLTRRVAGARQTAFRLGFSTSRYLANPVRNGSQWSFRLTQRLRAGTGVEVAFLQAPNALASYLRDPRQPAADSAAFAPLRGSRQAVQVAGFAPLQHRLGLRLEGTHTLRSYDPPFEAVGSSDWAGAAVTTWKSARRLELAAKYQYSNLVSRGRNGESLAGATATTGDGSYHRNLLQASVTFDPRQKALPFRRVTLLLLRQATIYTSARPASQDPAHVGRRDVLGAAELRLAAAPLFSTLTLEVGGRQAWTVSKWTGASPGDNSGITRTEHYADRRIWLGVSYSL